ncbi:MAG: phosphohydrolase [Candidatus Delongbacteria bacterium]|jgi:metal-dependent HD superfamily phosphatase/phosphodiesterase|nr:phosphohydrolase [Candidatus Delongbacteria bacterium]
MTSPKEIAMNKALLKGLEGKVLKTAELLLANKEISILQDYANNVSITRLNFNDHGPVHMRQVAINAVKIIKLMNESGIIFNLETEKIGSFKDSMVVVLMASFLHDIGMSIGRDGHERMTITLTSQIIENILKKVYPKNLGKQLIVKSMVYEGIIGHMGTQKIHSLEAGIILIADGCDMEKGRARIPLLMETGSKVGDIHKYSSAAIKKVYIEKGKENPVRIQVEMTENAGFFQIEEVLMKKINMSPVKKYIELYAGVIGMELKRYL